MPVPFPEFAEPLPTLLPKFEALPYEALPTIAEDAPIIGEFVLEAAEVGAAAALAEPALIIGSGLLAGAAANAIFHRLFPSETPPQQKASRGGGRIGGGSWQVNVHYETTASGPVDTAFVVAGNVLGLFLGGYALGSAIYYIFYEGGKELVLSDPPEVITTAPYITGILPYGSTLPPNIPAQPVWVNPGVGLLPPPTTKTKTLPDGSTVPYTFWPLPNQRATPNIGQNQPYFPGISVYSPEIGLFINFGPLNINVGYTTGTSTDTLLRVPPGGYPSIKEPKPGCPCPDDAGEILCRVKRLQTDLLNDGYEYTSHTYNLGNGGNIDGLPDEFVRLEINVNDSVQPIKKERASGSSDEVWYAGWHTFRKGGKDSVRTPISYQHCVYFAPDGADGFGVSIAYGGSCSCVAVTRRKKPYVDNC